MKLILRRKIKRKSDPHMAEVIVLIDKDFNIIIINM
jgi:hypothetical protein